MQLIYMHYMYLRSYKRVTSLIDIRVKRGPPCILKKSSLEASCRTKLVAPPNSDVHARAVARLEALKVFY